MEELVLGAVSNGAETINESTGEAAELLATAYAGSTVSMGMIVTYGICLVLMVAIAVAVAMWLRNHVKNWVYPVFAGAAFSLTLTYLAPQILNYAINLIPPAREFAEKNLALITILMGVFQFAAECLAIFLGVFYFLRSSKKKDIYPTVAHMFSFGLAFYIVQLLAEGTLFGYYEGIFVSNTINSSTFEGLLTSLVQEGGNTQEEVERYLLGFVNARPFDAVVSAIVLIARGVIYTASSVVLYGVLTKKAKPAYAVLSFALIQLFVCMTVTAGMSNAGMLGFAFPSYLSLILSLLLASGAVVLIIYFLKVPLKDECYSLKYSRKAELKKQEEKKNKMPTIVMPKD